MIDMAVRATAKRLHFSRKRLRIVAETGIVFPSERALICDFFCRLADLMGGDVPIHG